MELNRADNVNKIAVILGYLFSYSVFTGILFLIVTILKNEPSNPVIIISITALVALLGFALQKYLK